MPSTRAKAVTGVVALLALAYSVVIAQQLLFGVVWASLVLLAAAGVSHLRRRGYAPSMGRARTLAVVVCSALVMLYALVVAQQVLLGLFAVSLVVLAAWVMSSNGPFGGT